MAKMLDKLNSRTKRTKARQKKRKAIMGDDMYRQDMRETKNKAKAVISKDTVTKVKGREAVKRVSEYRKKKKNPQFTLLAKAKKERY